MFNPDYGDLGEFIRAVEEKGGGTIHLWTVGDVEGKEMPDGTFTAVPVVSLRAEARVLEDRDRSRLKTATLTWAETIRNVTHTSSRTREVMDALEANGFVVVYGQPSRIVRY